MDTKGKQKEKLPTVAEMLDQLVNRGTVLVYPEKPIIFKNSPQSAVKTLSVNICSTESLDMVVLHKLHAQTRTV